MAIYGVCETAASAASSLSLTWANFWIRLVDIFLDLLLRLVNLILCIGFCGIVRADEGATDWAPAVIEVWLRDKKRSTDTMSASLQRASRSRRRHGRLATCSSLRQ